MPKFFHTIFYGINIYPAKFPPRERKTKFYIDPCSPREKFLNSRLTKEQERDDIEIPNTITRRIIERRAK